MWLVYFTDFFSFGAALKERPRINLATTIIFVPEANTTNFDSQQMQGPGIDVAMEDLRRLYGHIFHFSHTYLVNKARPQVPLLVDDVENFVARFYYEYSAVSDGLALLSPCSREHVPALKFTREFRMLHACSSGSGDDGLPNPQHFSVSIYTVSAIMDFCLVLFRENRWSAIAGMVHRDSIVIERLGRVVRLTFLDWFAGSTPAHKDIHYYDHQYSGDLEAEKTLRTITHVARVVFLFGSEESSQAALKTAEKLGMAGGDYVFFMVTLSRQDETIFPSGTVGPNTNWISNRTRIRPIIISLLSPYQGRPINNLLQKRLLNAAQNTYQQAYPKDQVPTFVYTAYEMYHIFSQVLNATYEKFGRVLDGFEMVPYFRNRTFSVPTGNVTIDSNGIRSVQAIGEIIDPEINQYTSCLIFDPEVKKIVTVSSMQQLWGNSMKKMNSCSKVVLEVQRSFYSLAPVSLPFRGVSPTHTRHLDLRPQIAMGRKSASTGVQRTVSTRHNTHHPYLQLHPQSIAKANLQAAILTGEMEEDDVYSYELASLNETLGTIRQANASRQRPAKSVGSGAAVLQSVFKRRKLTDFEKTEISAYSEVYFLGATKAAKSKAPAPKNDGFDDQAGVYQFVASDHVDYRYELSAQLGTGAFGQVYRAHDHKDGKTVALKIMTNNDKSVKLALQEIRMMTHLGSLDVEKKANLTWLYREFDFRNHKVLVMDACLMDMYSLLCKRMKTKDFEKGTVRKFALGMLRALRFLEQNGIIHCDLKPENVLLVNPSRTGIKLCDFNTSCLFSQRLYHYLQSRYYRAPEILLRIKDRAYGPPIDMWSFGCVLAEIATGSILFPGGDEGDMLAVIMETMGLPTSSFLAACSASGTYFAYGAIPKYCVTEADEWGRPGKLISGSTPCKALRGLPGTRSLAAFLHEDPTSQLVDLLRKCLEWDPAVRITASQALTHAWILNADSQ
ncbi:Dual specificity tyrosine-phosphorylation-regulated kinase mbk-2 [Hypsibius exemplaris]|uniref:dual-specificity kinase n=1 Tax=Hypsibius exemplaris TaxID=2072580 RepID=A0A1W0X352_HYPEX|nr:Dual specificity tyrosine-phosphorylation-regulated kinase mbk-2 [Hypsibius exemplaris]